MSSSSPIVVRIVRAGAIAGLLALGACGDRDATPIVADTSNGQALSFAPNGSPVSSDYKKSAGPKAGAPWPL